MAVPAALPIITGAALAVGCVASLPPWKGVVPPVVPRADPCGSGELTAEGRAMIRRLPYLQSVEVTGAVVAWASLRAHDARVVVALGADPERAPVAEFPAS